MVSLKVPLYKKGRKRRMANDRKHHEVEVDTDE